MLLVSIFLGQASVRLPEPRPALLMCRMGLSGIDNGREIIWLFC
jgi:hypothetical protein